MWKRLRFQKPSSVFEDAVAMGFSVWEVVGVAQSVHRTNLPDSRSSLPLAKATAKKLNNSNHSAI